MDSTAIRMMVVMALLLSSFAASAEGKPICSKKKFKNNDLVADRVNSILNLVRFNAKFAPGRTVTKILDEASGQGKCSAVLTEGQCESCMDDAIDEIKGCGNAFSGKVTRKDCFISYTARQ